MNRLKVIKSVIFHTVGGFLFRVSKLKQLVEVSRLGVVRKLFFTKINRHSCPKCSHILGGGIIIRHNPHIYKHFYVEGNRKRDESTKPITELFRKHLRLPRTAEILDQLKRHFIGPFTFIKSFFFCGMLSLLTLKSHELWRYSSEFRQFNCLISLFCINKVV